MDEMNARSGFTGITLSVSGFDAASKEYEKRKMLEKLLQDCNGESLSQLITDRLKRETLPGRTLLAPIISGRDWFKRCSDGKLFRCDASTFGRVSLLAESGERDLAELNNLEGWKSAETQHLYIRLPPVGKETVFKTEAADEKDSGTQQEESSPQYREEASHSEAAESIGE